MILNCLALSMKNISFSIKLNVRFLIPFIDGLRNSGNTEMSTSTLGLQ